MAPSFSWFNPQKAVRIYRGNLPHWRQDGCLYFITFRLADSIPRTVAAQWQEERRAWFSAHGIAGYPDHPDWKKQFDQLPEKDRKIFDRMNARRLFAELDRHHGDCLLRDPGARKFVFDALRFFDHNRWKSGDFVIMPNHVHALVQPLGQHALEETLYSVKRFSARKINSRLERTGSVWQKEYYDHVVRDRQELDHIRRYIAENPAKANLPESAVGIYRAAWLDEALV
jgi:type I restriction enzyme R subunit